MKIIRKTLQELASPNKHPAIKAIQTTMSVTKGQNHGHRNTLPGELTKAGVPNKVLGSGEFGTVFDGKKAVRKVYKDKAYHAFAQHAKSNQDNPHLPKIHSLHKVKGTNAGIVKMEKLHNYDHPENNPLSYDSHTDYGNYRGSAEKIHDVLAGPKGQVLKADHPGLHKTISDLAHKFPNHRFDLHSGNIMLRHNADGTKTHVITDPIINNSFKGSNTDPNADKPSWDQSSSHRTISNDPKFDSYDHDTEHSQPDHMKTTPPPANSGFNHTIKTNGTDNPKGLKNSTSQKSFSFKSKTRKAPATTDVLAAMRSVMKK